jgi:hypothetical protein
MKYAPAKSHWILPLLLLNLLCLESGAAILAIPQARNAAMLLSACLFYFGFKWRGR